MNFQVVWSAIQPLLAQLLQSAQFQAVLQKILADILAKINSGMHPDTAVTQATGQIGAAALLHLTGNPVADVQALIAKLQPHATTAPETASVEKFNS